jgi:hypothetical protein
MTAWKPTWTRDPLPADVTTATVGPACGTCHSDTYLTDSTMPPLTRSTEPNPADGLYVVQLHQSCCPVWTGETPDLPCPTCGAPVESHEFTPGYSLAVPHPVFGTAHIVGTAQEVFDHPDAVFVPMAEAEPVPSMDRATVSPCGHVLQGEAAHRFMSRAAELRAVKRRAEAEALIAAAQPLLDSAEAAGQQPLARAYREAVRARSTTAPGLLVALQTLDTDGIPR